MSSPCSCDVKTSLQTRLLPLTAEERIHPQVRIIFYENPTYKRTLQHTRLKYDVFQLFFRYDVYYYYSLLFLVHAKSRRRLQVLKYYNLSSLRNTIIYYTLITMRTHVPILLLLLLFRRQAPQVLHFYDDDEAVAFIL